MSDVIGWRQEGEWLEYDRYTFNTNALKGHLPSLVGLWRVEGERDLDYLLFSLL